MAALTRSRARKAREIVMFTFRTLQPSRRCLAAPVVAINAEKAHADGIAANWGTLSHQFATNQHRRANRPWSCPGEKIWIRVTDASHPLGREP